MRLLTDSKYVQTSIVDKLNTFTGIGYYYMDCVGLPNKSVYIYNNTTQNIELLLKGCIFVTSITAYWVSIANVTVVANACQFITPANNSSMQYAYPYIGYELRAGTSVAKGTCIVQMNAW